MEVESCCSIGTAIKNQALKNPDKYAVICVSEDRSIRQFSWKQLHELSNRLARFLAKRIPGVHRKIAVELGNSPEHILWALAIWKTGGCYIPVPHIFTSEERDRVYPLIRPDLVIRNQAKTGGCWDEISGGFQPWISLEIPENILLEDHMELPSKGMLTGGTTGLPKLVFLDIPMSYNRASMEHFFGMSGQEYGMVQLIAGPIYHGAPATGLFMGLMAGHTVVMMEHFQAELAVQLIEEYQVQCMYLVPTMMKRMSDLEGIETRRLTSIRALCHTGGYCTEALKRKWIDLIGPEHLYEIYSMTEVIGMTAIRGDEWLRHPGSVGKGLGCQIEIRVDGCPVPPGEVGEIYMRQEGGLFSRTEGERTRLSGERDDGFYTVGDLGWMEPEGYLHFVDRRDDIVVTGGKNVYVSEVEKVLLECDYVCDAAVTGVPDPDWGRRLCAFVVLKQGLEGEVTYYRQALLTYMKQHLSAYKVPKDYHFVQVMPRNPMGKLMRRKLS